MWQQRVGRDWGIRREAILECVVSLSTIKLDKAVPVAVVDVDVNVDAPVCWHELQSAARVGVTIWQDENTNSSSSRTMANAFMCRNEKLLSACAIWTQFGNAFRHIKLKWPETGPSTGVPVSVSGSGLLLTRSVALSLSFVLRCRVFMALRAACENCWHSQENQKAKVQNNVKSEIVWRLCCIKAKCSVYFVATSTNVSVNALYFYLHVSQLRHTKAPSPVVSPLNSATHRRVATDLQQLRLWQTIINMWHPHSPLRPASTLNP